MKRLAGDESTHWRSTDHSGEVAWLAYDMAADTLEGHDSTGWSLDNWPVAREFVEFLLGHEILENGV